MKKIILLVALFVSAICATNAQSFNSSSRYVGLSLGVSDGYGVPVSVIYEQQMFAEKIGFGGVLGFSSNVFLGVRGNYHFLNHDKFDVYGGAVFGFGCANSKWQPDLGIHAGGRYLFNDQFAAFTELGFGIGNFSLGATYSF